MKIGDKVTYKNEGVVYYGTIVWLRQFTAIVQKDNGARDEVNKTKLNLI